MSNSPRHRQRMSTRRAVLGDAHVNRTEAAMHVRAIANTGVTCEEVREAMPLVAIHAGVPAANHAIKIVKQTYDDMDAKVKPV